MSVSISGLGAMRRAVLLGTVGGLGLLASVAHAQSSQQNPQGADVTGLEEVVVTATRQADTVNRVPLSIAAVTQTTLDEQGIKQAQDLARTVPGLNAATGANTGVATFSIRGIVATVGAATTGVYLDDTAMTKRANSGIFQGNGAPIPVLFDLERVEVLKGPQGTLYGGSSQGGTVRFITPNPSLTTFSANARIEGTMVRRGEEGYDIGAAIGGPIVADKLGFRISGLRRKLPGWIDAYSAYDNSLLHKDGNGRLEWAVRGALLWQVNDRLSAMLTAYYTSGETEGGPSNVTTIYGPDGRPAAAGTTFTTPITCTSRVRPANLAVGAQFLPTAIACPAGGQTTATVNVRPSYTYGPFTQRGEDDNYVTTGTGRQKGNGVENDFLATALTFNYDFERMNVKSITSYIEDNNASGNTGGGIDTQQRNVTTADPAHQGFPLFRFTGADGIEGNYTGGFRSKNRRYGLQQELRFSSPADQRPLTWVGGIFYSNSRTNILYHYNGDSSPVYAVYWGLTGTERYGLPLQGPGEQARLLALIADNEIAAFGEANYWLTEKLKLTAGLRFSRVQLNYDQLNYGQFSGRTPQNPLSITRGDAVASPTTPKIGLTYEFTSNDLVYLTAAKGFRAGGVNPQLSQATCDVGLTQAGITAEEIPVSYAPDSVWSYEAGGKFRLLDNKMQLNGAVYRIDWNNIQATIPLSCGFNFVMNGGKARSEGFDLQMQYRPFQPLTLTLNAAYTNARYIDQVAGPKPGANVPISINAGDKFFIPPWQVSFSAQYNRQITSSIDGFLRLDYQWQSDYQNNYSFGTSAFSPFNYRADSQDLLNLRVGVRLENGLDVNVYANNLLDSHDRIGNAGIGRTACSTATATRTPTCNVYTNYNPFVAQAYQQPRLMGVQVNYRF